LLYIYNAYSFSPSDLMTCRHAPQDCDVICQIAVVLSRLMSTVSEPVRQCRTLGTAFLLGFTF
jgi:hypothetical protein